MAERKRKRNSKKPNSAQMVTTGTTMRMQSPKSNRRPKPRVTKAVVQEVNPARGFVEFIREHAIVGLAIGFIVGAQARVLVDQIVKSFVDPAAGLLVGGAGNLSSKTATLHHNGQVTSFAWGAFVYSMIDFIGVLIVVYVVIKVLNLEKLDKKKD